MTLKPPVKYKLETQLNPGRVGGRGWSCTEVGGAASLSGKLKKLKVTVIFCICPIYMSEKHVWYCK